MVVLRAGGADGAVELGEGYVEDVREGEVRGCPAGGGEAGVQPVFGAVVVVSGDSGVGVDGGGGRGYPFGPVLGVTSSVAPWALGLLLTPGLADWA